MWESKLKKAYYIILISYCSIYVCVAASSSFLGDLSQEQRNSPIRFSINLFNAILIFVCVGFFEVRQFMGEGFRIYFSSLWNICDLFLFCCGITLPIVEMFYLKDLIKHKVDLTSGMMDYRL